MSSIEKLLTEFRSYRYSMPVDDSFVETFIEDRKKISELTRSFLEQDRKYQNLLKNCGLSLQLQLGTHRFGQSTLEEHQALDRIVRNLRPEKVLEIGVFRGHTALTLCRAMDEVSPGGSYVGIDSDESAIAIAGAVLESCKIRTEVGFEAGKSQDLIAKVEHADLVFIDGDHLFPSVAKDCAESYNIVGSGGVLVLHDIGTRAWGFHQDPGHLFYDILPGFLDERAQLSWLDSMCRELTMSMLSPTTSIKRRFCDGIEESLKLAELTSVDTVRGAGGLGFILKSDDQHRLNADDLLAKQPPAATSRESTREISAFGKMARRLAERIP